MNDIQPPPSIVTWFGSLLSAFLVLLWGSLGWSLTRSQRQLDDIVKHVREEIPQFYAKSTDLQAAHVRIAELVSRAELAERLEALELRQDARIKQIEEMQRVMNDSKLDVLHHIRDVSERRDRQAEEFRDEMRKAFNALALKLEAVATKQQLQGDRSHS